MHDIDHIALEGSIHEMRLRLAIEQSAMHKVRQAVARWRTAAPVQQKAAPHTEHCAEHCVPLPCQSRWHDDAQCHFMCWLEAGGFTQEEAPENSAAAEIAEDHASPANSCMHCPT